MERGAVVEAETFRKEEQSLRLLFFGALPWRMWSLAVVGLGGRQTIPCS